MKIRKIGLTTKYTLAICTILLVVNIVLGILIMNQSGAALKNLIRRHMLSTAETAAAMVDGDELEKLTAEDVGTESFQRISDTLTKIKNAQNDVDIKYIYMVKRQGEHYVYTVDPDPEDPADFGEEVVDTPGQDPAWFGEAEIDPEPVEDEWGCYYTAWCPVRNSSGTTIGMVGIDFAADWYDMQMTKHRFTVVVVSCLSLVISLMIISLMTLQLHRRFRQLDGELSVLSSNVEDLARAVKEQSRSEEYIVKHEDTSTDSDMIRVFSEKIHSTQHVLTDYMQYLEKQAYTDDMTGVANKDAYLSRVREINEQIEAGTAAFCVAVFDVDNLKSINDNYGHEYGDHIIVDTARQISSIFGREHVYRIGGDEFIAVIRREDVEILPGQEECGIKKQFDLLAASLERFNREERDYEIPLSFSMGSAMYQAGEDKSFKDVFKRADMAMYKDKGEHHK